MKLSPEKELWNLNQIRETMSNPAYKWKQQQRETMR